MGRARAGHGRQQEERSFEAFALRLLGEAEARATRPQRGRAETHFEEASKLADELGLRPLVGLCRLGLGGLYRRLQLAAASALFSELAMPYWNERAAAEISEMGGTGRAPQTPRVARRRPGKPGAPLDTPTA